MGQAEGMVKFVSDAKTDKILGAHIMGPGAGTLLCCATRLDPMHPRPGLSLFAAGPHA